MPKFYVILAGKSNKISKIFMIFAGKMTELYMIIAEKIFSRIFVRTRLWLKMYFLNFGVISPLCPRLHLLHRARLILGWVTADR